MTTLVVKRASSTPICSARAQASNMALGRVSASGTSTYYALDMILSMIECDTSDDSVRIMLLTLHSESTSMLHSMPSTFQHVSARPHLPLLPCFISGAVRGLAAHFHSTPTSHQAFLASLSAFLNALFLIPSCITLFWPTTNAPIVPTNVASAQCIIPCVQYGVLVYAIPCAPPLLPSFANAARTNAFGVGVIRFGRRIFDIADVTR